MLCIMKLQSCKACNFFPNTAGVSDMMIGFCSQLELIRVTASETMEAYIILCNLDDGQEEQERKRFLRGGGGGVG